VLAHLRAYYAHSELDKNRISCIQRADGVGIYIDGDWFCNLFESPASPMLKRALVDLLYGADRAPARSRYSDPAS